MLGFGGMLLALAGLWACPLSAAVTSGVSTAVTFFVLMWSLTRTSKATSGKSSSLNIVPTAPEEGRLPVLERLVAYSSGLGDAYRGIRPKIGGPEGLLLILAASKSWLDPLAQLLFDRGSEDWWALRPGEQVPLFRDYTTGMIDYFVAEFLLEHGFLLAYLAPPRLSIGRRT